MTLAVMSRATLGHSGRPLIAPVPLALAYALLPLTAGIRWVAYFPGMFAAGFLWMLAYVLYATALWPAFWGPRQDVRS